MANWQRTLNLLPEWNGAKDPVSSGYINIRQLAEVVSVRLMALNPFDDSSIEEGRLELVADFHALSKGERINVEEFDSMMSSLYDWADTEISGTSVFNSNKVCWVKTF